MQPESIKIYRVVANHEFFINMNVENFNAQTSEVDLTTGVKGREVKISLPQKKKWVAFGLENKEFL